MLGMSGTNDNHKIDTSTLWAALASLNKMVDSANNLVNLSDSVLMQLQVVPEDTQRVKDNLPLQPQQSVVDVVENIEAKLSRSMNALAANLMSIQGLIGSRDQY